MSTLCKSLSSHLPLPSRISQYSREGTTLELGRAGEKNKMTLQLEPLAPVGWRASPLLAHMRLGRSQSPWSLPPSSWGGGGGEGVTRPEWGAGGDISTSPDPTEEGLEQGPSHRCGSCVTSAPGRQGLPDQVLPVCWRKGQTTHDRTHFSGCQGEAVGSAEQAEGWNLWLNLSVCYAQSGGFGVWFSYFTWGWRFIALQTLPLQSVVSSRHRLPDKKLCSGLPPPLTFFSGHGILLQFLCSVGLLME